MLCTIEATTLAMIVMTIGSILYPDETIHDLVVTGCCTLPVLLMRFAT